MILISTFVCLTIPDYIKSYCSVIVSDFLQPHGLQHSRLPCLLEFFQIHVHWVGNAIWTLHPLLSPSPFSSMFPSIRVFSNELAMHIKWPKCLSFSFSISLGMLSHFSHVWFFRTPCTVVYKALFSIGFSWKEYWRGLPCPPPGNLPDPGAEPTSPVSPALQADYFITEPPGKPSASVLSKSIQCWFPLGQTGLVTLQSKGLSKVFSSTTIQKHQFCGAPALFVVPTLISICDYWKKHSFAYVDISQQSGVSVF